MAESSGMAPTYDQTVNHEPRTSQKTREAPNDADHCKHAQGVQTRTKMASESLGKPRNFEDAATVLSYATRGKTS